MHLLICHSQENSNKNDKFPIEFINQIIFYSYVNVTNKNNK